MSFHEFNSKYQETLNDHLQYILPSTSESKEGNQQTLAMDIDHALQTGLGWKRRQYYVGDSMVFLSIDSWSLLEKMVKDRIKSERRLNCNNDNNDNNTDSIIGMSPNTSFTGYSSDAESFYASECESELLEKSSQSPLSLTADIEKGIHSSCPKKAVLTTTTDINQLLPKKSTSKVRSCWLAYVWLSTWWIPSCCLSHCGKMRSKDQRIAWREKISLFFIILLFCGIILFFIVGLGWIVCPVRRAMSVGEIQDHSKLSSSSPDPYVYMYGEYFDARSEANTHISRSGGDTKYLWEEKVLGQDVSQLFNKEGYWDDYCNFDKPNSFILFPTQLKELAKGKLVDHLSTQASDPQNYIPSIRRKWLRGVVVWNKDSLSQLDGDNKKILVMYNRVYDVSSMFYGNTDANFFLGHSSDIHDDMKSLIKTFTSSVGSDASSKMDKIRAKSLEEWKDIMGCMKGLFYIGQIDHRNDLQCMIPNYILLVAAAILVSVIGFKFIAALQLGTKRQPEHRDKFVICMVTCYTEGEQSISKTINALAVTKFDDRHKLLFVICDGMIIGAGNDQPTPRLVLNLLGVDPLLDATSLKFQSLGEGNKQLNYGKVYSGLYCIQGRSVPFVVVVKVGKPTERQRPGNR